MHALKKRIICFLLPTHWSHTVGGAQFQARLIVEHLLNNGNYGVYILSSRIGNKSDDLNYTLINIGNRKGIRKYSRIFDAPTLLRILNEIHPDIIYQRVGCAYTGIAAYYCKRNNCKLIWNIAHEMDISPFNWAINKTLLFDFIEKKSLEYGIHRANHIIAQTQWQKSVLGINYKRVATVIPNFHPLPKDELIKSQPIKVLWIANIKPWKGPDTFIRLAKDFQYIKDIQFTMVGKSMLDKHENEMFLKSIEGISNLTYLGACSQEKVNSLLAISHIFVNTSLYEGFPNTFIQAWLRKTVIVSLHVNPDNIFSEHGKKIGLFAGGLYDSLKSQLRTLIKDTKLREQVASQGQLYAWEKHSENNIQQIINLIDE